MVTSSKPVDFSYFQPRFAFALVSVGQDAVAFLGGRDIKDGEPIPTELLTLDMNPHANSSASVKMEVLPYSFISFLSKKISQGFFLSNKNSDLNSTDNTKELDSNINYSKEANNKISSSLATNEFDKNDSKKDTKQENKRTHKMQEADEIESKKEKIIKQEKITSKETHKNESKNKTKQENTASTNSDTTDENESTNYTKQESTIQHSDETGVNL